MNPTSICPRKTTAREAYLWACDLELRAFKPGNVSDYAPGHDMTADDFRISAKVSVDPLIESESLGARILGGVTATRKAVGCNTNLGILLLAAPLIEAFLDPDHDSLEASLRQVLARTQATDAESVFAAICHAKPGGLGDAAEADVRDPPQVTLLEAMALAAERDSIARQYTCSFSDIFRTGVPMYDYRLSLGDSPDWAAVAVFITLLRQLGDSHIERKFGKGALDAFSDEIAHIEGLFSGPVLPENVLDPLRRLDLSFKSKGVNPGTTADMTVASLMAHRLSRLY